MNEEINGEWNYETKERKIKQTFAQIAERVPRASFLSAGAIIGVIYPPDGPTLGRDKKSRRKARRRGEGGGKGLTTTPNQSYVQLVGQGRHKRHNRERDRWTKEQRENNQKQKDT